MRAEISQDYLPYVDGLRALAIALVVAHHAWPDWVPGGYVGVDVFFVISGFIITRQIAGEIRRGEFSFLAFLSRRARRLVPAATVCLLLTSVAAAAILAPEALVDFRNSLVAAVVMVANIFFYETSGYFAAASAEKPLLHMWSLAVEDQFYLTWPLLLLALNRWLSPRRLWWAVAALAAVSLVHAQWSVWRNAEYAFYWLFPRAFELLLGCLLALTAVAPAVRYAGVAGGAGLAVIVASAFALTPQSSVPGLAVLPCCLATAAVIWSGLTQATHVSRGLSSGPVVFTGKMSYSLYLYHWPLLSLATYAAGRTLAPAEAAALVGLAIGAAVLSWHLVEQKLTTAMGLRSAPASNVLARAAALAAVACGIGWTLGWDDGWKWRLNEAAQRVYTAAATANPWHDACDGEENVFANDRACTLGKPRADGAFDFAIIGDSNADHFVPMMHEIAIAQGVSGRQLTRSTCSPIIGLFRARQRRDDKEEACAAFQAAVLKFVDANPSLRTVVLSAAWQDYQSLPATLNEVGRRLHRSTQGNQTAIQFFVATTVKLLRDRGLQVVLLGQIPRLEPYAIGCFARAAEAQDYDRCGTARDSAAQKMTEAQQAFKAAADADPHIRFIDMLQILCPAQVCSGFRDGAFLYRNRSHLNGTGAAHLARHVDIPLIPPASP